MINRRLLLSAAGATLSPLPSVAVDKESDLNAELDTARSIAKLPALAAAVVKQGRIVASGAVGIRSFGSNEPVKISDRFHIGSDTKAFTSTLAATAIDEGKLTLTTTVEDVLSKKIRHLTPRLASVTLEQLLSHTGGIPSDDPELLELYFSSSAFKHTLPESRIRLISAWKAHGLRAPGAFSYANLGYIIAGAMIETVLESSWEEAVIQRVFNPLGLSTAGIGPQATMGRLDAAVGHQVDSSGKVTPMPWGPAADVPPVLGPAGAAHMSVLDFAKWAGWNASRGKRGPQIIKTMTLEEVYRPRISTELASTGPGLPTRGKYALGWGVIKFEWTEAPVLDHNGSNSMNLAKILVDQDRDLGVVVMTNFPGKPAEDTCKDILKTLYVRYAAK